MVTPDGILPSPRNIEVTKRFKCPNCVRDYMFPLITQESLEYPGIQNCKPVHGYGISNLYYTACHYPTYLIPALTQVYEVMKISGYTCEYVLEIKEEITVQWKHW